MYTKCIDKVWVEKMKEELIDNHNSLLWEEEGIHAQLFCHLRSCIKDYGVRTLIVPEYRPTVPENAKCGVHEDVLEDYRGDDNFKVDLCIVEFERDLSEIDPENSDYKNCNLWCFGPKPVVAIEIKYTWKEDILKGIKDDIHKLDKMLRNWNTQVAYLCLVTDIENEDDYREFVDLVKSNIKNNQEKFRIAVGSWNKRDLWKVEKL